MPTSEASHTITRMGELEFVNQTMLDFFGYEDVPNRPEPFILTPLLRDLTTLQRLNLCVR
jgi:hypothetical protein